MKTTKLTVLVSLGILFFVGAAKSSPLPDFSFKNPLFNGNGYGTYALTIENEQYTRQQAIQQALEAAKQQAQASQVNTPVNQFLANLQSRIYAQISQNLATAMFSPGAATSGTMNFQGNTIFWQNMGDSISLVVTDTLGNQTSISVPLGSFTFIQPGAR